MQLLFIIVGTVIYVAVVGGVAIALAIHHKKTVYDVKQRHKKRKP